MPHLPTTQHKRPLLNPLQRLLRQKKHQLPPKKRQPDEYYKRVWLPKSLYNGIEVVAKAYKLNIRQTILLFIAEGIKKHMALLMQAENERRSELKAGAPYRKPTAATRALRGYIKSEGGENPRIDKGFTVV
jgi:hypothetical protein